MVFIEFIALLAVIVFAAYLLSRGAETLAAKWGFNIVGSLVLALLTTLPEYAFVYWASIKGHYQMAIGSAIGSCTLLITLGYGLVIVLAVSKLSKHPVSSIKLSKATRVDAVYLLVTAVLAFIFIAHDNKLSFVEGIILTAVLVGYVYHVFKSGTGENECNGHPVTRKQMIRSGIELLVGGALVFICSEPFVDSMIHLAEKMQVSPIVIAVVLGPLASEMPEKLTAYLVVLKDGRNAELAVCNFLGSKVNHNSLLLAVMPFVAHTKGHDAVTNLMSPMLILMSAITVVVSALLAKGELHRWQGYSLIIAYFGAMVMAVYTQPTGAF
ncbi:MAG: sodium:calcium antiporter [Armatimonadota bacterium]|jgi:cation:H+ antiporter